MYPALTLAVAGVTVRAAGGDCDFHASTQLSGACWLPLAQLGNSIVTLAAVTGAGKLPPQRPWKLDLNAT